MRIVLGIVFVVLFALFLVSLTPNFLIVVLVTFGLAGLSNTVLLYLILCLPLLWVLTSPKRPWPLIALGVAIPVLVGIVLPIVVTQLPSDVVARRLAGDKPIEARVAPAFVEYTDPAGRRAGPPTICDSICQSLLVAKGVERVRLTSLDYLGHASSVDVALADSAGCATPMEHVGFATQAIKDHIEGGGCITIVPASPETPLAHVQYALYAPDGPASVLDELQFLPTYVGGVKQVTITVSGQPDLMQTQVLHHPIRVPLMLDFAYCTGMCLGPPMLARSDALVNQFDEAVFVRQVFGVPD